METRSMKQIFKEKDKEGGLIEICLLEDLVWLHTKTSDGEENGMYMTTGEAVLIAEGLLKAVNNLKTYIMVKKES